MLEGLGEVDWSRLTHAYGRADDTPDHLRALLSDEPEARGEGLHELFSSLCHQGTIYDASAAAARFIAEIARAEAAHPRVRVEALWLLDCIASGGRDAYGRPQNGPAEAARQALRSVLPPLLRLIDHKDRALSLSASVLAARFPDAGDVQSRLSTRLDAASEDAERCVLAAALVLAGSREPALVDLVRSAPDDATDPDYRERFGTGDEEADRVVVEDLLGWAVEPWLEE
jgi:hypothetical protein